MGDSSAEGVLLRAFPPPSAAVPPDTSQIAAAPSPNPHPLPHISPGSSPLKLPLPTNPRVALLLPQASDLYPSTRASPPPLTTLAAVGIGTAQPHLLKWPQPHSNE